MSLSINLSADEKILHTAKKHWFYLLWPFVFTLLTGGLLIPWAIYALLRFLLDEIIVTSKKVYIKTGVISKSVVTTPIEKVNNINISKGLVGRILDYGTIVIQSGATLGASGYSFIRSPEELQHSIECKSTQG